MTGEAVTLPVANSGWFEGSQAGLTVTLSFPGQISCSRYYICIVLYVWKRVLTSLILTDKPFFCTVFRKMEE